MPEISLSLLSLIFGALAIAGGAFGLAQREKAMDFSRNFPRHETIGPVLILAGMTWFLFILHGENMADFEGYRRPFYGIIIATGVGACFFLKDYLAVRGLAVLMILVAKLIVDTARFHESDWRILLVSIAYAKVVAGMWFTVSPWRMRDMIGWATANENRFKILCATRLALGVLLVVLGLTAFN